ncbi:MAG: ATP-dependent helicase HrpB [Marinomonas sp.]
MSAALPIYAVLDALKSALNDSGVAVLVAPPGAGKTTAIAPALIDEPWCDGQIILTSPRRVAARAAAERMAQMLGEKPGETIGYLTRLDSKQSSKTRVLVMTEAIFVNRLVDDPELSGVSAVLFDEAHERHLDSDLGLALALEARSILREDLRVLVMSATIDGARFASLIGDEARVIESEGRSYPLEIRWLGSSPDKRIDDAMTSAIMTAWREEDGDILSFLPGVGEIERVRERLEAKLPDVPILPLHGQVQPAAQRAAIARDKDGRRRIVLATAIAETSLTLDGVSVVVDSGMARMAEHDRAAGTTHLVTRRASQAAATQRAGRAARQSAGVAYRLWEEGGHGGRPEFAPPEIETADLTPLMLKLAKWGTSDPKSLAWLDTPPDASVAAARGRLHKLGALDEASAITPFGSQIARLPMDPVAGAAVLFGAQVSQGQDAAQMVLLMQERGLGGQGEDLLARLDRFRSDRGGRAEAARKLAMGWAKNAERLISGAEPAERLNPALFLAFAMPDNIARRRGASGEHWLTAGGRGFTLDPASPLARAEWLVIGDAVGGAKGARITAATELSQPEVEESLHYLIEARSIIHWNAAEKRAEARLERRLGAITMASGPDPDPDPQAIVDMLVDKAVERLGEIVPAELIARAHFTGIEALSLANLAETAPIWLAPLLENQRNLGVLEGRGQTRLNEAILGQLDWETGQRLQKEAPRVFKSPAGSTEKISYVGDDAPSVEVRVQALFGLDQHPMIGNVPLLLKLTSPAGRPIQSTRDLPGFWRGSWDDVRKDMKGRYPKHRWPDEPWSEMASLKTKNAFEKRPK